MEELIKKYPALCDPKMYVTIMANEIKSRSKILDNIKDSKELIYKNFKANISCIGLDPEEYETVIKWFCDTMEY